MLTSKRRLAVTLIVIYAACQAPLGYFIARHWCEERFPAVVRAAAAHAPNQFAFLPVVLPVVLYALYRMWVELLSLETAFGAEFLASRTWRFGVRRNVLPGLVLVAAVAVGVAESRSPGDPVVHDWYQLADWTDIASAADLNDSLARNHCFQGVFAEPLDEEACKTDRKSLGEFYRAPVDTGMLVLEAIELSAALLAVGLTFLAAVVCCVFRLRPGGAGGGHRYPAALRTGVAACARPLFVAAIAFAAFAPLRGHNYREIESVAPGYESTHPSVMLLGVLLLLAFTVGVRFGVPDEKWKKIVESMVSALFAIAFGAFVFEPAPLAEFLYGLNLPTAICLLFLLAMAYWGLAVYLSAPAEEGDHAPDATDRGSTA